MLQAIGRFFGFFAQYTQRLGVCGNAGLIVGAIAGGVLTLLDWVEEGNLVLSNEQALYVFLLLVLFTWLVLIFIFVAFVRARISDVVFPGFFNALFVCLLTVYLCTAFDLYHLGWLVGILVGIVIGYTLCTLYKRVTG